jgi:hypothetical protein
MRVTFADLVGESRERVWAEAGVPKVDIEFSRLTGMDARDVRALREFSSRGLLVIVRCPNREARVFHGVFPPKHSAVKAKTGTSGTVDGPHGGVLVSDYDLMSVWRTGGEGPTKVFVSAANGAARGPWLPEARAIVVAMNQLLVSRIQHGCNDDWQSAANPGIKPDSRFAVFRDGSTRFLPSRAACRDYYAGNGLSWPYDDDGRYNGPKLA